MLALLYHKHTCNALLSVISGSFSSPYLYNHDVFIDGDRIIDYQRTGKKPIPADASVIDGENRYLGPGLIDIHTHAGGGVTFFEEPDKAANFHLMHGSTSLLAALYFNLSYEDMVNAADKIRQIKANGNGRNILGLYMEGPYLNPKYGCEVENNKWAAGIKREAYLPLIEEVKDLAKVWCIAPEMPKTEMFVEDVLEALPGIVLAVAHSEATPYDVERYIPLGLRLATHHTNATGTLDKYPECRGVSVDEAVNSNDDIYAELICDNIGIHVDPYMLRLVMKIKGRERLILISDAFVSDGPTPPGYEEAFDINFDHSGEIAGSKLTLDVACRNMIKHTGVSLVDVFNFASYNPAKLLSLRDLGELVPSKIANLVLVDERMNIDEVIFEGQVVDRTAF